MSLYHEVDDCKKILELSRQNLACYQKYEQKTKSIKKLWSATCCVCLVGIPALMLARGLLKNMEP